MSGVLGYAVAIPAALMAGGFNATTAVLQQEQASTHPDEEGLSPRLLARLARDRRWLLGMGAGVGSYLFQGVALAFGALALVQPLVLSELVFAVPVSVRRHRLRMRRREWSGVGSVVVGLAVGIVAAHPRRGQPLPPFLHWGLAMAAVALLTVLVVAAGRLLRGTVRASLYALGAATMLALQSAFLNGTTQLARGGPLEVVTHWQPYALVPSTLIGILLMQSAYQAGPLAASTPVVDAAEPVVAIVLGVLLFMEHVNTSIPGLVGSAAGLGLFLVGVFLLDTSQVVRRIERKEDAAREPGSPDGPGHSRAA